MIIGKLFLKEWFVNLLIIAEILLKIPFHVKYEIQNKEMETSEVNEIVFGKNSETNLIQVQLNELKLFSSIPISKMGGGTTERPITDFVIRVSTKKFKTKAVSNSPNSIKTYS